MSTTTQHTSQPATHTERLDGPVYVEVMDTVHGLRITVCVSIDADSCARVAGKPLTELQLYSTSNWLHDTVRDVVVELRDDVVATIKYAVQPRLPNPIVHAFEGPTASSPTAVLIPCEHAAFPAGSTVYINGGVVSYTVLQSGTLGADADAEPHYALRSTVTGETHGPVPQSALTTTNGAA